MRRIFMLLARLISPVGRSLGLVFGLTATPFMAAAQEGDSLAEADNQDWQAIVVGQPGPGAHGSFADAFFAAQAFEKGGLPIFDMIRDLPRDRLTDTLAEATDLPQLVLYYSGRMNSGSISMQDGSMPLQTVVDSLGSAGTTDLVLMIENCTDTSGTPSQVITPEAPEGMRLTVLTSAPVGGGCTTGARLSDQLRTLAEEPELTGDLTALLHGLDTTGPQIPVPLTGPRLDQTPVEEIVEFLPDDVVQIAVLDGDFSLSGEPELIQDDVIEIVLPAQLPPLPEEVAEAEPIVTFAALPQAQLAALPIAAGLPEPSIIVGLIEGVTDASLSDEVDSESTALASFVDDNREIAASLATLRKLRKDNPEFYTAMLEAGTFDPPEGRVLAKVLQTELGRMNCYRGGIDGDYGRGSQRASSLYYEELQKKKIAALASPEASIPLFRLMLGNDAVDCPVPVAAPAPSRPKATGGTTKKRTAAAAPARKTTSTKSAPARSAPSAPARSAPSAPARSSGGGSFGGSNFGGVFR